MRVFVLLLAIVASSRAAPRFHAQDPLDPEAAQKASQIIDFLVNGEGKGQSYTKLAEFVDTIGSRVSGGQGLENAVTYMIDFMRRDGLENVHGEVVTVPKWVRGNEYAELTFPRTKPLAMLGLGLSIGTGPDGIEAPIVVVTSFDELRERAARNETQGKIIVFNQYCDWVAKPTACYGETSQYRGRGASEAALAGGVATLIRSLASFSIDTPHTGSQTYVDGVRRIPAACISTEDADLLARFQARGIQPSVRLYMEAQNLPDATSYNVVGEVVGDTYPDEVVVVGGHLDSWDVGQGAMDDGSGAVLSWQILSTALQLGLRPTRTLRVVLWTCEEFGGFGAKQYYQRHQTEAPKISLMMESDMGDFSPIGVGFTGSDEAREIMLQIAAFLEPINATSVTEGGTTLDTAPWEPAGVPLGTLRTQNDRYFYFHHTHGDTMSVYTPEELDRTAALYAVTAFTVADMPGLLPRETRAKTAKN